MAQARLAAAINLSLSRHQMRMRPVLNEVVSQFEEVGAIRFGRHMRFFCGRGTDVALRQLKILLA